MDASATLEQTEHRNLTCRTSATRALANTTEVTFIDFHFAIERKFQLQMSGDDVAQFVIK